MTARVWAYVMATAATVYMAFAVWQAYLFAKSGSGLALALAVAVLALPLIGLWVKLLKVPKPQLYAGILIFATVGPTACAKAHSICSCCMALVW